MSETEGPGLVFLDSARDRPINLERETDEAPEQLRRLIVFQACDEWFGLPIEWVREIQPLERVTRVPDAPPEILGILNLRGRVLALFDLAGCLGIPRGTRPATHAVVLETSDPDLCIGIAAQRIAQVRDVPASDVQPSAREGGVGALEGAFELDGHVVGLLDLSRVLTRILPETGAGQSRAGLAGPMIREGERA
jgi:purine-binding chemotaxis protein CheW